MKNNYRNTDLALEGLTHALKDKDYRVEKEKIQDIKIEVYKILKENTNHHYKKGTYIELQYNSYNHIDIMIELLKKHINRLIVNLTHKSDPTIMIVGLGNKEFSVDALGPVSVSHINATHHYNISERHKEHLYDYICIIPNVAARSGIETADYVESLVRDFNVDLIIAIDSLRAFSYEKLCKVIQINDIGIYPGSGIGNHRKGLNKECLGIPVIGIGIPTVIHASSLINHLYNKIDDYLKLSSENTHFNKKYILGELGELTYKEREQLLAEILYPLDKEYILTHKQIDYDINILSRIISETLNNIRNI